MVNRQIWFSTKPSVPAAVIATLALTLYSISSSIDFPPWIDLRIYLVQNRLLTALRGRLSTAEVVQTPIN